LNNQGILVYRANGELADYHSPVPGAEPGGPGGSQSFDVQALAAIGNGRQKRLHQLGVPLGLVRKADGSVSVEAQVVRGEGLNAYMMVFTPENPRGERRENLESPLSLEQRRALAVVLEH
jgi:hypothetical protein